MNIWDTRRKDIGEIMASPNKELIKAYLKNLLKSLEEKQIAKKVETAQTKRIEA